MVHQSSPLLLNQTGVAVPKVLVSLKEALVVSKGFQEEGVFRLAGSESKMKEIKAKLDTNTVIASDIQNSTEIHCVASLIKAGFPLWL
jgi:hypothetical protein